MGKQEACDRLIRKQIANAGERTDLRWRLPAGLTEDELLGEASHLCPNGHDLTDSTNLYDDGKCRPCQLARVKAHREQSTKKKKKKAKGPRCSPQKLMVDESVFVARIDDIIGKLARNPLPLERAALQEEMLQLRDRLDRCARERVKSLGKGRRS